MKFIYSIAALAALVILSGCGPSGEEELRQWLSEQRANAKPKVTPLVEPKQFNPEPYKAQDVTDPFDSIKLLQAIRRDSAQTATNASLIAKENNRRKEPLEAFPLDSMAMVGSMTKEAAPTAILKIGALLYPVKVGSYIGQNYGKITKITETEVQLREVVQDATGEWVERMATLDLQEGKK